MNWCTHRQDNPEEAIVEIDVKTKQLVHTQTMLGKRRNGYLLVRFGKIYADSVIEIEKNLPEFPQGENYRLCYEISGYT